MMHTIMRMRRRAGISCAHVQDLVQAYLDGELAEPGRTQLAAHLELCRPCGVDAETYDRIKTSLAAPAPAETVERLEHFAATLTGQGPSR